MNEPLVYAKEDLATPQQIPKRTRLPPTPSTEPSRQNDSRSPTSALNEEEFRALQAKAWKPCP